MLSMYKLAQYLAVLLVASTVLLVASSAAGQVVTPPEALRLENVPPIARELADRVNLYTEFRGHGLLDWHPQRRELLIARLAKNTAQVYRLTKPGQVPEQLTDFPEPIRSASYPPGRDDYFLIGRDERGNERFRLFRFDVATRTASALSPADRRASGGVWAHRSGQFFYSAIAFGTNTESANLSTEIRSVDPLEPDTDQLILRLPGSGWGISDISADDRQIIVQEYVSATESYLWIIETANGARRLITPKRGDETVRYGSASFAHDGKSVITTSDRGSEFRRLVAIDLGSREERVLVARGWDITRFVISEDGARLAYLTNEDGKGVLRVVHTADGESIVIPALPRGSVGSVAWHRDGRALAFSVGSSANPATVYALDLESSKIERWSPVEAAPIETTGFVEPDLVRWKSFDGRVISGYLYRPAAAFSGPRPVIIDIHGGPESQWRPGFIARYNYYLNEMGIALLFPNVRGSDGYGKSFLKLDDGRRREDSVRDIGALLDWIETQPQLDAARVLVTGGSYGGYMSLATATHFPDRIACAISNVGIANFVSFLENTESYRRDLRRVEYGDERDPAMRRFLNEISPLTRAARIKRPLMIVHGENDPRVPISEARSIIATVKRNGTPVSSIIATNEGHGFARKANADYLFYANIAFARECLKP